MIAMATRLGVRMSDVVLERIAGWEATGVIDAATAEKLREAETAAMQVDDAGESSGPVPARTGLASSFFGPAVSIVEVFSYLGGAFVLAAWIALITRLSSEARVPTNEWILVAGAAVPAVVFFALGLIVRGRSARLSRAAGVSFLLSVAAIWTGVTLNAAIVIEGSYVPAVIGTIAAVGVALVYRWFHPAVLTLVALLAAITGLVEAGLQLLDAIVYPPTDVLGGGFESRGLPAVLAQGVAWIGCALVIGL